MNKTIWIAWERQRRSIELANAFSAELHILISKRSNAIRYLVLLFRTINLLINVRPKLVFVQNPSIVLAVIVITLKPLFRYSVVVDRHTNFKFKTRKSKQLKWVLFHLLSKFSLRYADLTIVTNRYLRLLVNNLGGNAIVLQDKLPETFTISNNADLTIQPSALFVCTYADDEPFNEVFNAVSGISDLNLYVSGRIPEEIATMPLADNIHLLGFVSDEDYSAYLSAVNFVVVLTTQEFTLNCGSYEAISMNKPMMISNTKTIQSYFRKGAVYVDPNSTMEIKQGFQRLITDSEKLSSELEVFREELKRDWQIKFDQCVSAVRQLS